MKKIFKLLQTVKQNASKLNIGNALFGKYLIITNTVASGLLMTAGDLIQQANEQRNGQSKDDSINWNRNGKMTVIGFTFGPLQHYYYTFIDHVWPKPSLINVLKKVIADQCIMSPFYICLFFLGAAYLDHKTRAEGVQELKDKFIIVYTTDWVVWPPVQFINFYFVPQRYRVSYINVVTLIYNVYLSYIKHGDDEL